MPIDEIIRGSCNIEGVKIDTESSVVGVESIVRSYRESGTGRSTASNQQKFLNNRIKSAYHHN
jgi:hypothetical protein